LGDFKNEEMPCRRAAPVVPEGGWAGLRARVNVRPTERTESLLNDYRWPTAGSCLLTSN
jgi:hypothetical protein